MAQWRFQGAKLQAAPFPDYFVVAAGGAAAGAGAALPDVVEAAGG
jgi:hypothetical protein